MALHPIGYMARLHGVSTSTIRRWEAAGLIGKALRTLGGHRRFLIEDNEEKGDRKVIGYARVSSHDQKNDLVRQIERLKAAGCDEVLSDIGSGLNCKKPGLRRLMRLILDGRVSKLVVLHEDRLLRFGVPLVRFLCERMKTAFEVVESSPPVSFEAELAKDVVTLMTVFCARLYGRRGKARKNRSFTICKIEISSIG